MQACIDPVTLPYYAVSRIAPQGGLSVDYDPMYVLILPDMLTFALPGGNQEAGKVPVNSLSCKKRSFTCSAKNAMKLDTQLASCSTLALDKTPSADCVKASMGKVLLTT